MAAIQATLRRIGFSTERRCSWQLSRNLAQSRALSDNSDWLSDNALTRKSMEDAAREDRLDFQTAARLLMTSSPQDERKFGCVRCCSVFSLRSAPNAEGTRC